MQHLAAQSSSVRPVSHEMSKPLMCAPSKQLKAPHELESEIGPWPPPGAGAQLSMPHTTAQLLTAQSVEGGMDSPRAPDGVPQ